MPNNLDLDLRDAIQFHGHLCPGLALGYRVAKAALRELGAVRPQDEELVAVVESDSRYPALKKRQDAGEDVAREMQEYKMQKAGAILTADEKEIMTIASVTTLPPEEAKIRASVRCASCGEKFMESRGRVKNGVIVCIPCFEKE